MATLQDRYCLLISTNGILQEESLFKCKLSDLCDLVHDNVLIHVMQIATGKTNGLKILYGQCISSQECQFMCHWCLGLIFASKIPSNI